LFPAKKNDENIQSFLRQPMFSFVLSFRKERTKNLKGIQDMRYLTVCAATILLFITGITAQPKQSPTLYRLDGGGIQCSIDAGANWEKLKLPFNATAFNWDAKTPERILAGTKAMVYRSSNGGSAWYAVLTGSTQFTPKVFSASRKNPFRIYCAGTTIRNNTQVTEVYQSMDGGVNWLRVMVANEPIEILRIDPDNVTQKISFSSPDVKQLKGDK
jgi:hypothetical protein